MQQTSIPPLRCVRNRNPGGRPRAAGRRMSTPIGSPPPRAGRPAPPAAPQPAPPGPWPPLWLRRRPPQPPSLWTPCTSSQPTCVPLLQASTSPVRPEVDTKHLENLQRMRVLPQTGGARAEENGTGTGQAKVRHHNQAPSIAIGRRTITSVKPVASDI